MTVRNRETGVRDRGRRAVPLATPVLLSTISQGFSGASNFIVMLALGRSGGAREVGLYALPFIVYGGALGVQRASLTDALMARRLGSTAGVTDETRSALTSSATIGSLIAVLLLAIGLASGHALFVLLAIFLVPLLLQDACRYLFFRTGRHAMSVVIDGVWFVGSATALLILPRHGTAMAALTVWGSAGVVAAVVGLAIIRLRPVKPQVALSWWREHLLPSGRWLVAETLAYQAELQVVAFGFTAIAGAKAFGTYQLAGSLVGLSIPVTTGIAVVAVSRFTHGEGTQLRAAALVTGLSFGFVCVVTLGFALTSGFIVPLLYGDGVQISKGIILATGAIYAFTASSGGVHALLRSRQTERILPIARITAFVTCVPLALVVSARNFTMALWVLAFEGVVFLLLTWSVAVMDRGSKREFVDAAG